jgi:hypothetical protein
MPLLTLPLLTLPLSLPPSYCLFSSSLLTPTLPFLPVPPVAPLTSQVHALIWQNTKRFLTQRAQAKYERAHALAQKEWEREREKESDKEREKEGEKNSSYYGYTENNRFFTPSSFTDLSDKPYDVVVGTNYGIKVRNSIFVFLYFFLFSLSSCTTLSFFLFIYLSFFLRFFSSINHSLYPPFPFTLLPPPFW